MSANDQAKTKLIKLEEVLKLIPVSKATWYRIIEENETLKPIKIGRGSFWKSSVIENYIDSL